MAVSKATFAHVLDGFGRPIGGPLARRRSAGLGERRRRLPPAPLGPCVRARANGDGAGCAPTAGRLAVTLTRGGRRVARRTVTTRLGGVVSVRFTRPGGSGTLRAAIRFSAAAAVSSGALETGRFGAG